MFSCRRRCWNVVGTSLWWGIAAAMSWASEPIELDRGADVRRPQQPQANVDAQGAIHIVYGIGDRARYRRSDDGGKTFTKPVDLPELPNTSLGMRRGPRIAVSNKSICVTVISGERGKGRDGDLWAIRSNDGGNTWARPVRVNDAVDSAREGLHAMSAGPNGEMCCVWLDLRHGKTEVMASISNDGGGSWSKNTLVYKSPDGSVCECCHPSLAIDGRGRIHVQWRNSVAGARDIYVASSTDGGTTFGKAFKLGAGSWRLDACPMDGGALAAGSDGKLVSAWRRGSDVFLSLDGEQKERRVGTGEQPWIAATDAGPFVVWLKRRGDVLYLLAPGSSSPIELGRNAADPVIASGSNGRGPIVAAWESREGKSSAIQCQVLVP